MAAQIKHHQQPAADTEKSSGHLDQRGVGADTDEQKGDGHRADHLKAAIEIADIQLLIGRSQHAVFPDEQIVEQIAGGQHYDHPSREAGIELAFDQHGIHGHHDRQQQRIDQTRTGVKAGGSRQGAVARLGILLQQRAVKRHGRRGGDAGLHQRHVADDIRHRCDHAVDSRAVDKQKEMRQQHTGNKQQRLKHQAGHQVAECQLTAGRQYVTSFANF